MAPGSLKCATDNKAHDQQKDDLVLPSLDSHTLSSTTSPDVEVTGQQKEDMLLPPIDSHGWSPTTSADIGSKAQPQNDLVLPPLASHNLSQANDKDMNVTGQWRKNMLLPPLDSHSPSPTSSSSDSEVCALILIECTYALIIMSYYHKVLMFCFYFPTGCIWKKRKQ